jgi:hypothetical protein
MESTSQLIYARQGGNLAKSVDKESKTEEKRGQTAKEG